MRSIRIIAVGRLKTAHWKTAAEHYLTRLTRAFKVEETIIKDGNAALPPLERNAQEGARIVAALTPADLAVCMDETGRQFTSQQFSAFLTPMWENANLRPCFIIGGAYGLSDEVRGKARHTMALSAMTFPHEMARVVLYEQLYRADAILRGTPYHH
ncbi:SPOUT methyltransferase [Oleidesulfovibrio alaskensis G20]|jgi:23S rRNA (pseudouridine1915-N3)-methyltransferase|uniref:Ribosomal RNA large subunit methyltransferase H n=1 Tax=Oleidesulfovibrio alaskensis (strain ATCC BAA-1058 / DSM 17464 / G20) TaxID=207559 RepID=RLMH_OLEA2|nr:23S rRNA (pseudouridine(1915)-N(3))-methyltransferase RlmH [Oleidesulfovibrio alaskensis]Q30Z08.1 RecName: Full=Ribosomal RNA large subunit methyltransferase H; AltName: Full=23S rRNA (pseudouridine1915-N3)-methyltransferase; AltName: Full=23S rRNA m3Psi1915 methyltransferase; AltName: Full=rRNA (pseudouridine-N3-)-methyltransferase RlmH [Oleidesulfovibrio alaskensis G20]ABB39088.1 SPOUT methyltransferase [Oleidesulfovibrio alaskensis G20]MBG0772142.1 23S rRNA (pseudouridine(1915)-N(3))-methy